MPKKADAKIETLLTVASIQPIHHRAPGDHVVLVLQTPGDQPFAPSSDQDPPRGRGQAQVVASSDDMAAFGGVELGDQLAVTISKP